MRGPYTGPRDGKGNEDHVSIDWLGGQVTGAVRYPDYPGADKYSAAVRRRILRGKTPKRTIAAVLGWRKGEAA